MSLAFSSDAEAKIRKYLDDYYNTQAALLPVLYVAQDEFGHLSGEVMDLVAERLGLSRMHVQSVATFYTMYHKGPVGKYNIQVCRTLSCAMNGAYNLIEHIGGKLSIQPGETTKDGKFTLTPVECLALCGSAPVMMINKDVHENLTAEKIDAILDGLPD